MKKTEAIHLQKMHYTKKYRSVNSEKVSESKNLIPLPV